MFRALYAQQQEVGLLGRGGLRQNTTYFTKFITLTTRFGPCGSSSGHKSTKGRLYIVYKHRYYYMVCNSNEISLLLQAMY